MVSLLALLPRVLTTFLYAVAALLIFYGNADTTPIQFLPLTILDWSLLAFGLGTASLVVNLGLEWNTGNRSRNREVENSKREDEERNKADRERERAASRARIQNRFIVLQIRHQLAPSPETQAALADLLSFLQEYGE